MVNVNLTKQDAAAPVLSLVQNDRRTFTVNLCLPRYADGVDLMGLVWFLRYVKPDGSTDASYLGTAELNNGKLSMHWTPGPQVTTDAGLVRFYAEGVRTEADDTHLIWQSGSMYISVGKTISVDTDDVSDQITELEQLISTVGQQVEPLVEEVWGQIQTVEQLKGSVEEAAEELRQMDAELTDAEKARADAEIGRVAAENLRGEKDTERAEIARRAEEASATAVEAAETANTKADMADEAAYRANDAANRVNGFVAVDEDPVTENTILQFLFGGAPIRVPTIEEFNRLKEEVEGHSVDPAVIAAAVQAYLAEHPVGGLTEAQVRGIVTGYDYMPRSEITPHVTDEHINTLIDGKLGAIENGTY